MSETNHYPAQEKDEAIKKNLFHNVNNAPTGECRQKRTHEYG